MLNDDNLDEEQQAARTRMLAADPHMVTVDRLARQFVQLVKERRSHDLDPWLNDVAASSIKALKSFANGIRADLAAVRNALKLSWSNGQTEGQINRLKFIKRQMYGRAKLDLLRKRVLYRAPDL
jgi:transposase